MRNNSFNNYKNLLVIPKGFCVLNVEMFISNEIILFYTRSLQVYTCGHAMYWMQYLGPVTDPAQSHPQRERSGVPLIPPVMFLRSAFFNFVAFFKKFFIVIWFW
ncbi:hypothetical protein QF024_000165 [Chryseobacterium nepalense]|nr:hypothetical protein [Chryseobacterium nepalense]